ncbi:MAG: hypothetical protein KJ923_05210 [Candidatus Omnitrophica bacterium]|nr:hypothetical protein [Candidatus Omnitrophota bacterium]
MFRDKVFQFALIASVIAHTAIFLTNPDFGFSRKTKPEKQSELTYLKPPQKIIKRENKPKMEPFQKLPKRISIDKRIPPPFVEKTAIYSEKKIAARRKITIAKPILVNPDIISIKKKITMPALDLEKINNTSYMGYYQLVREKIKRAAYRNYTLDEMGEVFVSFVISDRGALEEVRIMEERTASRSFLREVALSSVKDASPFPVFPKELDYPRLSFNVVISFEIE